MLMLLMALLLCGAPSLMSGTTWSEVFSNPDIVLLGLKSSTNGLSLAYGNVSGYYPFILKSTNKGNNWTIAFDGSNNDFIQATSLKDLALISEELCFAACDSGIIIKTDDGFKT
jgi:photosystem II stability/assembly factor-like uncharacterized protein